MQAGLENVPQEKRAFSPRGKITPLNGKIVGKVNSPRKKAMERHVYPLRLMFPKGGPISPRYRIKFTRDNFTSPRGGFFSSKEKIANNFTSPRSRFFSSRENIADNFTSPR